MKRRDLLACAGLGSIGSLAGCLGSADPSAGPEARTSSDENGDGDDDTGSERTVPTIDGQPCPPYDTVRERAVCAHTVDAETAAVSLESSADRSVLVDGLPADEITLTLRNRSLGELTVNPHSWNVWRNSGTEWTAFWREYSITGHRTVPPNDTLSWTFTEVVESVRSDPDLEPGLYAAELGVPDPTRDDGWVGCIALVRLESAE